MVVEPVRGLLDLSGEVTAEHDADRTAKWHRGLVRSFMGLKYDSGGFSTLDRMVAAIRTETNTAHAMVAARIDLAAKARLTRLL